METQKEKEREKTYQHVELLYEIYFSGHASQMPCEQFIDRMVSIFFSLDFITDALQSQRRNSLRDIRKL